MFPGRARDQYGRTISRGDTVALTGRVVDLLDDPDYVNCTVLLDQQMPPSGMQLRLDCNTMQLVRTAPDQQPPLPARLQYAPSRLAADQAMKRAALSAIGQSLAHVRQLMERLMAIDRQLRQFN